MSTLRDTVGDSRRAGHGRVGGTYAGTSGEGAVDMGESLAVDGGTSVREELLPPFRVSYGYEELREVLEVFENGVFCSVDPAARKVAELEAAFAEYVGTRYAVAFNSGTTAQHASLVAAGVGPGDEVVVPPLTFASTAYTVFMVGATPVFADVEDAP